MAEELNNALHVDFFDASDDDNFASFIEPEKEKNILQKITSKLTGSSKVEEPEDELYVDFFEEDTFEEDTYKKDEYALDTFEDDNYVDFFDSTDTSKKTGPIQ